MSQLQTWLAGRQQLGLMVGRVPELVAALADFGIGREYPVHRADRTGGHLASIEHLGPDLRRGQVDKPLVMQQGQDPLALGGRQGLPGGSSGPGGRRRGGPPPIEGRTGQPQGGTQRGNADLGAALLDQGDHDCAIAPGRPSSAARFFWASTRASARWARPVISASCRSSSAIFRSRRSTGVGFRPRFFGASAASSPLPRARRHATRWEEYNPSRRSSAPMAPGVVHASAAFRIRRLYSAGYARRRGFATTCTSSGLATVISSVASMGLSRLALISNFGGRDCLTHRGTEGLG
jgi:hypothetical protein